MVKRISTKKVGTSLLMSALLAGTIMVPMSNAKAAETPEVKYSVHVEDHAWMKEVSTSDQNAFAGTKGEARRMEAIHVRLEGLDDVTLRFKLHIEDYGDRDFTEDSPVIGTTGEAKRLEGITVYADGLEESGYKLQYRVHIENEGDQDWRDAGEFAGSRGKAQRLESIQFRLISKAEEELENAKDQALTQLRNEFKASDYTINAKDFSEAMAAGEKAINESESVADVISELKKAQTALKAVPSDNEERKDLDAAKDSAVTEFITYLSEQSDAAKSYSELTKAINGTRKEGTASIDNASSAKAVEEALTTAKENVLKATKTAAQTELDKLYKEGKTSGDTTTYLTAAAYKTATDAIKAKDADMDAVIGAYDTAVKAANATTNMVTLDKIKETAGKDFETYTAKLTADDGAYANVKAIQDAITAGETAISKAETRAEIDKAVKDAEASTLKALKDYVRTQVDKVYNNGKAVDGKVLTVRNYNKAVKDLTNAETVDATIAVQTFVETDSNLLDLTADVAKATKAIDDLVATCKSDVKTIVSNAKKAINEAVSARAIEDIQLDVEAKILASERAYYLGEIAKVNGKLVSEEGTDYYYTTSICTTARAEINEAETVSEMVTAFAKAKDAAQEAATQA